MVAQSGMTGPTPCFGEDKNRGGNAASPANQQMDVWRSMRTGATELALCRSDHERLAPRRAALRSNERAESTAVAGRFNPASVKGGY
jgi:hypothetical protein